MTHGRITLVPSLSVSMGASDSDLLTALEVTWGGCGSNEALEKVSVAKELSSLAGISDVAGKAAFCNK